MVRYGLAILRPVWIGLSNLGAICDVYKTTLEQAPNPEIAICIKNSCAISREGRVRDR